ncbi:MAG: ribosome silencing factor [Firmicutes bacterium]|nr:ribosome silencing factor [Bacillota bacterium]
MELLLEIVLNAAIDKKAVNPVVLDMRNLLGVADYFLICSGKNQIQVRAIADQILEKVAESGFPLPQKEGYRDGIWILLDFGFLVVHILQEREREFYALEQLWHDAKVVEIPSLITG